MPKQSLVINGFVGGINKDADVTDLTTKGNEENECVEAKNMFTDYRGKIVTKFPQAAVNVSGTTGVTDTAAGFNNLSTADKCLVYGGKFYQHNGVYKVGEIVTHSGDDTYYCDKPLNGVLAYGDAIAQKEGFDISWGPERQQVTEIRNGAIGKYLDIFMSRFAQATGNPTQSTMFGSHIVPNGDNIQAIYDNESSNNSYEREGQMQGYWDGFHHIENRFRGYHNGPSHGSDGNCIMAAKVPNFTDYDYLAGTQATDVNWTSSATYLDNYIKFGDIRTEVSSAAGATFTKGSSETNIDISDFCEFQIFYSSNFSGGFDDSNNTTLNSSEFAQGRSNRVLWLGLGTYRKASNNSTQLHGPYGNYNDGSLGANIYTQSHAPSVANKDVSIEYRLYDSTNVHSIKVYIGSGDGLASSGTYTGGKTYDTTMSSNSLGWYVKCYELTISEIQQEGGHLGWVRHTFPYASHSYVHGSYNEDQPTYVMLGISKVNSGSGDTLMQDADDNPRVAFREYSFNEPITSGWTENAQFILYQTRIKNGIESLPKKYGSITSYADKQRVTIHRPVTPSYVGRFYYQLTDADGNGIGDKFLIADVDYDLGVKTIMQDEFTQWDTGQDPDNVSFVLDNPPSSVTYSYNSGYPDGVQSINALYKTSATIGRQVYIANCAKHIQNYLVESPHTLQFVNSNSTIIWDSSSATVTGTEQVVSYADRQMTADTGFWTDSGNCTHNVTTQRWDVDISSGAADENILARSSFLVVGKTYEVTFRIPAYTSGSVRFTCGLTQGTVRSAAGTFTEKVICASNTTFQFQTTTAGSANQEFSIDNVSVKEVSSWSGIWEDGSGPQIGQVLWIDGTGSNDGQYTVEAINHASSTLTVEESVVNETVFTANPSASVDIRHFNSYDPELILKTGVGKAAGYPDSFYIDLEFGGDSINVLESTADRLFIFSNDQLTVINVAQDIEFIEATMPQMGVKKHRQVCQVMEGVAFVNGTGVYLFNGQNFENISEQKMNTVNWDDDNCAIGFDANRSILHVWNASDNRFFYNLVTKSWSGQSDKDEWFNVTCDYISGNTTVNCDANADIRVGQTVVATAVGNGNTSTIASISAGTEGKDVTAFVLNHAADATANNQGTKFSSGTGPINIPDTNIAPGPKGYGHYEQHVNTNSIRRYIGSDLNSGVYSIFPEFITGQISCGNLAQRKKFYKVYITHKNTDQRLRLRFSVDGGSFGNGITNGVYGQTTNGSQGFLSDVGTFKTTAVKINVTGKTLQLKLEAINEYNGISTDVEISDISIIYREKTLK